MTLEQYIKAYTPCCDGECDKPCATAAPHPNTVAALAELAALREQKAAYAEHLRGCVPYIVVPNDAPAFKEALAKARLEGAREAFDMAQQSAEVVVVNGCPYVDMLEARSQYLATFGEVAP